MKAGSNSLSQPPRILSAAMTETSAAPLSSFLASRCPDHPGPERDVGIEQEGERGLDPAPPLLQSPELAGPALGQRRAGVHVEGERRGRRLPRGLRRAVAGAVVDQDHAQAPPLVAQRRERLADDCRLVARRNQDRDVFQADIRGILAKLRLEPLADTPRLPGQHQNAKPESRARRHEPAPEHRHAIHERGPRAAPGAGSER